MQNSVSIPIARAFTEIRRNNGAKASSLLDAARPYELGQGPYQDFLAAMKHADPGVPIVQQAKAEYAKLQ